MAVRMAGNQEDLFRRFPVMDSNSSGELDAIYFPIRIKYIFIRRIPSRGNSVSAGKSRPAFPTRTTANCGSKGIQSSDWGLTKPLDPPFPSRATAALDRMNE